MLEPTRLEAFRHADTLAERLCTRPPRGLAGERLLGHALDAVLGFARGCALEGAAAREELTVALARLTAAEVDLAILARLADMPKEEAATLRRHCRDAQHGLRGLIEVLPEVLPGGGGAKPKAPAERPSAPASPAPLPVRRSTKATPEQASRLAAIEKTLTDLFPYLVSEAARKKAARADDTELTYGITPPALMLELLAKVGAGPDDVFYDLGCGVGHNVFVAAEVCGAAKGVELLPALYEAALTAKERLGSDRTAFVLGDAGEADVSDGTVFFTYSTCFGGDLRGKLARQIAKARPGARAISVTRPLQHEKIELIGKEQRSFGEEAGHDAQRWVFFHRVKA